MKTIVKDRLALFVFALLFASSITRAEQPPQPVEKLTVWDSNGKMVGVALDSLPSVALRVEGRLLILAVTSQALVSSFSGIGTVDQPLYFTSTDCRGAAYFDPTETPGGTTIGLVPLSILSGSEVYVPDGSPLSLLYESFLFFGNCTTQEATITATPLRLLIDLSNFFTPPFSIK